MAVVHIINISNIAYTFVCVCKIVVFGVLGQKDNLRQIFKIKQIKLGRAIVCNNNCKWIIQL